MRLPEKLEVGGLNQVKPKFQGSLSFICHIVEKILLIDKQAWCKDKDMKVATARMRI